MKILAAFRFAGDAIAVSGRESGFSRIDFLRQSTYGFGSGGRFLFFRVERPGRYRMDFDWIDCHFDLEKIPPREVEEAFEDPFSIRFLPEEDVDVESRYYALGKTLGGRCLFSVFWTDGKRYRVIFCRDMTKEEISFYERKNAETL